MPSVDSTALSVGIYMQSTLFPAQNSGLHLTTCFFSLEIQIQPCNDTSYLSYSDSVRNTRVGCVAPGLVRYKYQNHGEAFQQFRFIESALI